MGKKNKAKIPKKIAGFKLSKGSRKDLRKLLRMIEEPQARALALSALGVLAAYLGERLAEGKGPLSKVARKAIGKASDLAKAH